MIAPRSRIAWGALAMLTTAGLTAATAAACYKTRYRSCAALHANTGRICQGSTPSYCGDVIIEDANVADLAVAGEGEKGREGFKQSASVTVRIDFWRCNGQLCQFTGTETRRCIGREADESKKSCTGHQK